MSKGVSPIIAEVLLIGIAISAAVSAGVFIQDTFDFLSGSAEDRLSREDKVKSSEISIQYGFEGTNGSLLVDVANTGSRTLMVKEDGQKKWNMYVDGAPVEWNFTKGSSYKTQQDVRLNLSTIMTLNTTESFPSSGSQKRVEILGPYEIQANYVCFSDGSSCES